MTLHELWDELMQPERRWLGIMFFVSLLCHASAFFVFQTPDVHAVRHFLEHQPSVAWIGPLDQHNVNGSARESDRQSDMRAWLALIDPGRIALPSKIVSFEEREILFSDRELIGFALEEWLPAGTADMASAWQLDTRALEPERLALVQQAADSILEDRASPMPLSVEAPPRLSGAMVEIRGELAARRLVSQPPLPQPQVTTPLEPTRVRLLVDHEGIVLAALIEKTSTDPAVDEQALRVLQDWRFEPSTKNLEQAVIIIFWDVKQP